VLLVELVGGHWTFPRGVEACAGLYGAAFDLLVGSKRLESKVAESDAGWYVDQYLSEEKALPSEVSEIESVRPMTSCLGG